MRIMRFAAVLSCAGMAFCGHAEDFVTLVTNDIPGETSFSMGSKWSDGLEPHADAHYLVDDRMLRAPGAAATFGGNSLTLTNSGLLTLLSSARITVSNLQMRGNGRIHSGYNGGTVVLAGTGNIQTAPDEYFYFTGRNNAGLVYSDLTGDGALAFQIALGGAGSLDYTLLGDNSGFSGKIRVAAVAGKDASLTLDNASTVQTPMASFTADSILLLTNAALNVSADTTLAESSNRGITVQEGGQLGAAAGATFQIETPVAGDTLMALQPGTLALTAVNTFTNLVISNGTVRLSRTENLQGITQGSGLLETAMPVTNLMLAGGLFSAGLSNTVAALDVDRLTLAGGGLLVNFAATTQDLVSVGTLIGGDAGVTPICVTGIAATNGVAVRPVLASAALDTFSNTNFTLSYAQPGVHLPEGSLDIVREGNTPFLAFRQTRPVVVQTKTVASGNDGFAKAEYWSNAQVPSANNDYILDSAKSLYGIASIFPGHSLSIAHESAVFTLKALSMTFDDLRFYGGRMHNGLSGSIIDLFGSIGVYATDASPFQVTGNGNTINCFAGLKGAGALMISMVGTASNFRFNLYADNSAFTGPFIATNNPGSSNAVRIGIAQDNALGGPLPVFRSDAICFGSGTYLYALSNATLSAVNRGITQAGSCYYSVPTNTVLTIDSVITGSAVRKQDSGLLVLSGQNTYSGFVAEGGSVEVRNVQALGLRTVQFYTNTVLRLQAGRNKLENGVRLTQTAPLSSTDAVTVMPVFDADETLPVKFELPIFLINTNSTLDASLTVTGLPNYTTTISSREVDVSGTTRTLVYATCTFGGTVFMLR